MIDRDILKDEMVKWMDQGLLATAKSIGIHHQTLSKLLYTNKKINLKSMVKMYQWMLDKRDQRLAEYKEGEGPLQKL